MGFLNIFDKKDIVHEEIQEEIKTFKSIKTKTKNIESSLQDISKKESMPINSLNFKIDSYKTYYQNDKNDTPKELTELIKDEILTEENLLYSGFKLFQEYKIEVFEKDPTKPFPLSLAIGSNKKFTTVRVKIKANENIKYYNDLDRDLRQEIDKRLAKNGILIGLWDEKLRAGIKKIISIIRVNGGIKNDVVFDVCNSIMPTDTVNEEVIYHYMKKNGDEKKDDYSIHGVKKGDIVFEYIKPKEGSNGRNCKGEPLEVKSVELSKTKLKVSDDFLENEDENRILYIAKKDGYIKQNGDKYEIKEEFVVKSISQKNTGDINVGEDSNISVTVTEGASGVDAVGPGVEIDTKEICVAGHVANGAKIKAIDVEIKGQTHKSSEIHGKNVKIHLHKGFTEGDDIEIGILEGGVVVGDVVRIGQLSGGEVRAKEVYIETVLSNATVMASHHIEIDEIEGEGNSFIIDAKAQRGYEEKIKYYDEEMKSTEKKLKILPKELKRIKSKILSEKSSIDEINKNIQELKKYGKSTPASMILKLKSHQERIKEFNSLVKELKDAKIYKEQLHENLKDLSASAFEAKVINKSSWKEFNEVKFRLLEPPIEASFLPKDGEIVKVLSLKEGEQGDFHIKREENLESDNSS